jgi:hypothetical protein
MSDDNIQQVLCGFFFGPLRDMMTDAVAHVSKVNKNVKAPLDGFSFTLQQHGESSTSEDHRAWNSSKLILIISQQVIQYAITAY